MKKTFLFITFLFISLPLFAQEETLFNGKFENGGFGGPILKVTSIDKNTGLMIGGRGAWLINHTIGIGGGGYGLVSRVNLTAPDGKEFSMEFGYGGFILEYIYNSNKYIHCSANVLIGGGSACWKAHYDSYDYYGNDHDHIRYARDHFFVVEPEFNAEFNIIKWFRLNIGASYRLISGLDSKLTYSGSIIKSLKDNDLSGFSGTVTFKFGLF